MVKKQDLTLRLESAYLELLNGLNNGLKITEIAKYRGVSRQAVYGTLSSAIKKGWVAKVKTARYILTNKAFEQFNIEKKEDKPIDSKKIVKVRTELSFNGDIRNLKNFLLENKNLFQDSPIKEGKRDIPKRIRDRVIERDKGKCVLCGNKAKELDHIVPYCAGGKHEVQNLRCLCLSCHRKTFAKRGKIILKKENEGNTKIIIKNLGESVE